MDLRRFATMAAALAVVLAGCVVAWLVGFGSAGIENIAAAPIVDRLSPSLTAEVADAPQPTAMANAAVDRSDMAAPAAAVTVTSTTAAAPDEPELIAKAALTDSSHTMPPETPPVQVATASTSDPLPNDAKKAVSSMGDAQRPPDQARDRSEVWELRDSLFRRPPLQVCLLGGPTRTLAAGS